MKKTLQIRAFNLRPGKAMNEDLSVINNFLKQAEIMHALSVQQKGDEASVLLFMEHVREMKEPEPVRMVDQQEPVEPSEKKIITAEQLRTMDLLKAWRSAKAAQLQLPVFMILPNMAIESIAVDRPETLTHLTALKGMGPIRSEKYGREILDVVHGVTA